MRIRIQLFISMRIRIQIKTYLRSCKSLFERQQTRLFCHFWLISMLLDPDLYFQYGSGTAKWMRIRIRSDRHHFGGSRSVSRACRSGSLSNRDTTFHFSRKLLHQWRWLERLNNQNWHCPELKIYRFSNKCKTWVASGSGSLSKWKSNSDPNRHQNDAYPQHCKWLSWNIPDLQHGYSEWLLLVLLLTSSGRISERSVCLAFSLMPITSTVRTKAKLSVTIFPNSGKCHPYLPHSHTLGLQLRTKLSMKKYF